ncbi:P-type conjugative transfer protein TrbL [Acinetobacter baumannii]
MDISINLEKTGYYLIRLMPLLIIAILLLFSVDTHAEITENTDSIVDTFKAQTASWSGVLQPYAENLFWILAFIQFSWAMITLAFRGNDLGEWVTVIVNQILFIGFFYWLLQNITSFGKAILNSFKIAGESAVGVSLEPSKVFNSGLDIVTKMLNAVSAWSPIDSLAMIISSIVVIACFAIITAFTILALVEGYFVIYAGVLMMGFGGSSWTKDYAVKTLQYAVSVGAKIFVLALLLGVLNGIMSKWVSQFNAEKNLDIILIIGCSLVFVALVKIIPELIQGIINGASPGSGQALTSTIKSAVAAGIGAAAGAAGVGMATQGAGALASEQLKTAQANGTGPTSTAGKASFMAGSMMKNMGSSLKEDLGGRLSGSHHGHGTMGGRMAQSMNAKADQSREGRAAKASDDNMNSKTSPGNDDNTIS